MGIIHNINFVYTDIMFAYSRACETLKSDRGWKNGLRGSWGDRFDKVRSGQVSLGQVKLVERGSEHYQHNITKNIVNN